MFVDLGGLVGGDFTGVSYYSIQPFWGGGPISLWPFNRTFLTGLSVTFEISFEHRDVVVHLDKGSMFYLSTQFVRISPEQIRMQFVELKCYWCLCVKFKTTKSS